MARSPQMTSLCGCSCWWCCPLRDWEERMNRKRCGNSCTRRLARWCLVSALFPVQRHRWSKPWCRPSLQSENEICCIKSTSRRMQNNTRGTEITKTRGGITKKRTENCKSTKEGRDHQEENRNLHNFKRENNNPQSHKRENRNHEGENRNLQNLTRGNINHKEERRNLQNHNRENKGQKERTEIKKREQKSRRSNEKSAGSQKREEKA